MMLECKREKIEQPAKPAVATDIAVMKAKQRARNGITNGYTNGCAVSINSNDLDTEGEK